MKHVPTIAGVLLGALFLFVSVSFLLDMMPAQDPPPEGSPQEHFWAAFMPTGYMQFVKICELVGAVLTMIPRTRALGILILTPIVVNIFAYHGLVAHEGTLTDPMLLATGALTAIVLLCELGKILSLARPAPK